MEFWYDFASTYSYLVARRVAAATQVNNIKWRPFLLGPIFKAQGITDAPAKANPVKGRYMWRDLERRAERYGYAFRKPSQFPRNPLLAARVATQDEPWVPDFTVRLFRANFEQDRDMDANEIAAVLTEMGIDAQRVLDRANSEEVKLKLKDRTADAMARGIFGAPTFLVGDEMFWGDDRFEDALDWANKK
ncbi:hypothetical protein CTAYLR_006533 [Chrysophaeum taylorii]|uniref:Glutathione S-transferase kappa n=1 Tax=Chrysophaeum taylorii TaxID=2483200 RepID=A0AAD7UFK4_9STRA|nr:hypothetical protein CTAYLR_006533 [Chrysophaeum taylorii]